MVKRWGDQWWWQLTVVLKTGDKYDLKDLTLDQANSLAKEIKNDGMTRRVEKKRQRRRD